ncbi:MAG: hypothetical protein Q8R28_05010 [Dehalococcoidia bacterium]|nr:hypothetical protein [Dehalococcoidia bacterium]
MLSRVTITVQAGPLTRTTVLSIEHPVNDFVLRLAKLLTEGSPWQVISRNPSAKAEITAVESSDTT